jgi:hypothetical protein
MGSDPETTAHLLPDNGRTSVDTISLEEPLQEVHRHESGEAVEPSVWSDGSNNDREKSVSTKYMILLTCGTFG